MAKVASARSLSAKATNRHRLQADTAQNTSHLLHQAAGERHGVGGHPSTDAEADLERATDWARDLAGRFGMSEAVGSVRVLHQDREVFLGRD